MTAPLPGLEHIAAMDRARLLGRGGALPWRMPGDLARFRAATMGRALLVGRATWRSIGRALPGRTLIVLSRTLDEALPAGVERARSLDEALDLAERRNPGVPVMVGGGGAVYEATLARATRLHLTVLDATLEPGDAYYPRVPLDGLRCVEHARYEASERDPYACEVSVLERGPVAPDAHDAVPPLVRATLERERASALDG